MAMKVSWHLKEMFKICQAQTPIPQADCWTLFLTQQRSQCRTVRALCTPRHQEMPSGFNWVAVSCLSARQSLQHMRPTNSHSSSVSQVSTHSTTCYSGTSLKLKILVVSPSSKDLTVSRSSKDRLLRKGRQVRSQVTAREAAVATSPKKSQEVESEIQGQDQVWRQ